MSVCVCALDVCTIGGADGFAATDGCARMRTLTPEHRVSIPAYPSICVCICGYRLFVKRLGSGSGGHSTKTHTHTHTAAAAATAAGARCAKRRTHKPHHTLTPFVLLNAVSCGRNCVFFALAFDRQRVN